MPPVLDAFTPESLSPEQGSDHKSECFVRISALLYATWAPALVLGNIQSPEDDALFAHNKVLHDEPQGDFIWSMDGFDWNCYVFICMYIRKKCNN